MTTMTAVLQAKAAQLPPPPPGVDTPHLSATIAAMEELPGLAMFQFRADSQWLGGTQCRSTMFGFSGAGDEHWHASLFKADADLPYVLCGEDRAPTPVEYLLHALAGCLTAGIATIAAASGVTLHAVTCTVKGQIDLQGSLGLADHIRRGFQGIRITVRIEGDAPAETLRDIVAQAQSRSPVFDVLAHGVPVRVSAAA